MNKLYNFSIIITLSLLLLLSGCSPIDYISNFWNRKVLGKPVDWQKELVLDERRKPQENDLISSGDISDSSNKNQLSDIPVSNIPKYYNNKAQDSIDNYQYPGDIPNLANGQGGYTSEPAQPWLNGSSAQNEGALGNSDFNAPSYQGSKDGPSDPFQPSEYRIIRHFEPMAYEYNSEEEDELSQEYTPETSEEDIKTSKRTAKSMFPLEEYAPKSDVSINQIFDNNSNQEIEAKTTNDTDKAEDIKSTAIDKDVNPSDVNAVDVNAAASESDEGKKDVSQEDIKMGVKSGKNDFVTEYTPTNSEHTPPPVVEPKTGDIVQDSDFIYLPEARYLQRRIR
jgi:hypothetical protein